MLTAVAGAVSPFFASLRCGARDFFAVINGEKGLFFREEGGGLRGVHFLLMMSLCVLATGAENACRGAGSAHFFHDSFQAGGILK